MDYASVVFEFLMLFLLILCFLHALNRSRTKIIDLFTLIVYGIILEELTILFFREYAYGDGYLFMIQDVPVAVGMGWAAIIYSAMETSDMLGISPPLRPMYDTLLALSIDLSMDPIATRAGFWSWLNGGKWFGVPYGNFFGWICVVLFFSLTARWIKEKYDFKRAGLILAGSLVPLILILKVWEVLVPELIKGALIAGVLLAFLLAVLIKTKGKFSAGKPEYRILLVPFTFHIFFFILLIGEKIYIQLPLLLLLSPGMLLLGIAGHFPYYVRRLLSAS